MITVLDYASLTPHNNPNGCYHVQLIHRSDGCQTIAQHGQVGGNLRLVDKYPPGVPYAKAKLAYDAILRDRSPSHRIDPLPAIPATARPFSETDWRIATAEERDTLIAAPTAANRYDDVDHAKRVVDQADDALANVTALDAARRAELDAFVNKVQSEIDDVYREIARQLIEDPTVIPAFRLGSEVIQVTKSGAKIELEPAGTSYDTALRAAAREIGGSFCLTVLAFGGRLFNLHSSIRIPTIRSAVFYDVASVFTSERRSTIVQSAFDQCAELILISCAELANAPADVRKAQYVLNLVELTTITSFLPHALGAAHG